MQRLVVDEGGELIAGHGRHQALAAGTSPRCGVLVATRLDRGGKAPFAFLDNSCSGDRLGRRKAAEGRNASLHELGVPLDQLGFDAWPGRRLLHMCVRRASPIPTRRRRRRRRHVGRGDVWLLGGRHRLTCGDSTNPDDVARVLAGAKPHLMVTDPPYGVEYDPAWRVRAGRRRRQAVGEVLNDDRADWREAWALFPGDVAYIWHAGSHCGEVRQFARGLPVQDSRPHRLGQAAPRVRPQRLSFPARAVLLCRQGWRRRAVAFRARARGRDLYGPRGQARPFRPRGADGPQAIDRLEHRAHQVRNRPRHAKAGRGDEAADRKQFAAGRGVYEPFSGSGTTLIAAEITGRKCYAIELNEPYVDIDVKRWQNFTGLAATLEGDGRTFDRGGPRPRRAAAAPVRSPPEQAA
jgi:hypothetical protein